MEDEEEEMRLAIALSIEESKRNCNPNMSAQEIAFFTSDPLPEHKVKQTNKQTNKQNTRSTEKDDEIIARKMQQEENTTAKSFLSSLFGQRHSKSCHLCSGCLYGQYITVADKLYHPACFNCAGCGRAIAGSYVKKNDDHYHQSCLQQLFSKVCLVCDATIPVGSSYRTHPYFPELGEYCVQHTNSHHCYACHRVERTRDPFPSLPDGRRICDKCVQSVVLDSVEARPLYEEVLDFLKNELNLDVPKSMYDVPVLAVELSVLNEHVGSTGHAHDDFRSSNSASSMPTVTSGLTLSTRAVIRHMGVGSTQLWDMMTGMTTATPQILRVEEKRDVTAVLVLCGLPRILSASILAHEAFHVWCKLHSDVPHDLPSEVEEGMCQLISQKYLEYRQQNFWKGGKSDWDKKLIMYVMSQIETNESVVYGDGYRSAASASATIGLDELIFHIKSHKSFPML